MANEADKKAAKRRAEAVKLYGAITAGANIVYILAWFLLFRESWSMWYLLGFLLTSAAYAVSVFGVIEGVASGTPSSMSMDLFIVTITVQLLSLFSDKFWYLFLSVPAFGAYKAYGMYTSMRAMMPAAPEAPAGAPADGLSRKERRAAAKGEGQPVKPGARLVRQQYR